MIGVIAVLGVAYWYYQTAQAKELPALQWVFGGVIVYYLGFAAWMYLALRPLMGSAFKNHGIWQGWAMDISAVVAGIVLTSVFRSKIMLKQG